jgi:hypothetical protein
MEKPTIGVAGSRKALSGRRSVLVVVFAASLLLAFVLSTGEARACSCVGMTLEEQIQNSEAIFSGVVVDVAESADPYASPGPVTFDVEAAWKGVTGETAVFLGYEPGSSCDVGFEVGESYLVYAYLSGENGEGPLSTNICSGTKLLSSAGADLLALGPPAYGSELWEEPGSVDGGNSPGSTQYDNVQ